MTQLPAGIGMVSETLRLSTARPQLCQIVRSVNTATVRQSEAFACSDIPSLPPTKTSAMASKQTLAFFLVAMLAVASTFELTSSS